MAETEMAFEPTGIFDVEPLPTPPLSTSGSLAKADLSPTKDPAVSAMRATANDDVEMVDLEIMAEKAERASRRFAADTPPPDIMDEEGWEAEVDAMQAMDEPDGDVEARRAIPAATQYPRSSQAGPARSQLSAAARAAILASMTAEPEASSQQAGGSQAFEMEEGIFGGMESSDPVASSSRAVWTPPPDDDIVIERGLPPLQAETFSGQLVFFRRRERPNPRPVKLDSLNAKGGALGQPLHKLLAEVEELKSLQKAIELQKSYDDERGTSSSKGKGRACNGPAPPKIMWVDKYRPKKFSDLLGEDRVHREVLSWLKEWDRCVYGRAAAPHIKRFHPSVAPGHDGPPVPVDPLHRPQHKILLLSGPPGFGKTTLAHIVAQQAGYQTLEINASDDRGAGTVTQRIRNAVDAGHGLGGGGKPVCVVVDEVDGATGGGDTSFIKSLIKLIQDVPARKKTNTPGKLLRRPIICICNDLYASALRPLRPFARLIRFRKPQAQFLVRRLKDICEHEAFEADTRTLTTLVELAQGDVRSCLNTLQFIRSRSNVLTEEAIRSTSVGSKDTGTGLHTVWHSLFVPLSAPVRRQLAIADDGRYVDRLAHEIQASGDMDRLVQGCFEHYPHLKPLDATLDNLSRLHHKWLMWYDQMSKVCGEGGTGYEIMAYMPYGVVAWHAHLAAPSNALKQVEWPKADYEAYQAQVLNKEIATSMQMAIPPALRSLFQSKQIITELVPFLMRIISPPLKPVNANIVKTSEKATLARLVELMIPLGLKFWQEKGENGQPMMRLEPPIDVFVHYDGKRADDIAASRFAVRQLVAQAIDAELARRKGGAEQEDLGSAAALKGMYNAAKHGKRIHDDTADKAIATDFFGRKLMPVASKVPQAETAGSDAETDVFFAPKSALAPVKTRFKAVYKFHEGSSSAVRKTIKMSALM